MQAWFISDIHIKSPADDNYRRLCSFLQTRLQENQITDLILLGDLFDHWVGSSQYYARKYIEFVSLIDQLIARKVRVIYFEGNHDLHLMRFWRKRGVQVTADPITIDLGEKKVRLEHGDLINHNDIKYLKYREFSRGLFMTVLVRLVPGQFWDWLGEKASQRSRKHSESYRVENEAALREMIRTYAQKLAVTNEFDLIVTGHMHVRDEFEFEHAQKKVMSVNLGTWLGCTPQAYTLPSSNFEKI